MLRDRTLNELMQIVAQGGGLDFDASTRSLHDLRTLAGQAKNSGARLVLRNIHTWAMADLQQIAVQGGGAVLFVDAA